MNLGEEDLCVLMKILVENIGEGSSQHRIDAKRQMVQGRFIHYCWWETCLCLNKSIWGWKLLFSSTDKVEVTEKQFEVAESEDVLAAADGNVTEDTIIILLDFKIKEVCWFIFLYKIGLLCHLTNSSLCWFLLKALLTLKKFKEQEEFPFLVFHVSHLGIDIRVRKFDLCATTYIKEVTMKSLEFKGQTIPQTIIKDL